MWVDFELFGDAVFVGFGAGERSRAIRTKSHLLGAEYPGPQKQVVCLRSPEVTRRSDHQDDRYFEPYNVARERRQTLDPKP